MPTPLPSDNEFNDPARTQSQFRDATSRALAFLRGLLGSDGSVQSARALLGLTGQPAAYNNRGAWASGSNYAVNDYATNSGNTYLAVNPITNSTVAPASDPTNWSLWQGVTLGQLQGTSAGQGAAILGAKAVGGAARTQAVKNSDVVSIQDYGGAADWNGTTGTENYAAVLLATQQVGTGVRIRFPFVAGGTNQYYFNPASNWAAFANCQIEADPGVTFQFANSGLLYSVPTARFLTPVPAVLRDIGNCPILLGDRTNRPAYEKDLFLADAQFDRSVISSVLQNSAEVSKLTIAWPSGDTWVTDSGSNYSTPDAATLQYSNLANDAVFHVGMRSCAPGDEHSADFENITGSGTPTLVAMVRSTGGYAGVYFQNTDNGSGTQAFSKVTGTTGSGTDIGWIGKGNHSSYAPYKSVVTVRITGYSSFEVLLNGTVISQLTVAGRIIQCGFGQYGNAGSNGVQIKNWTLVTGKDALGEGLVNVLILGDSKTAPRTDCWPVFFREFLEGAGGLRVVGLSNYAIAGQDSNAQLTNLNNLGVPTTPITTNLCIIDIGTNDQQGAAAVSTLISNIAAMVAKVRLTNSNCKFLIASYSLWYTRTQTNGAFGQASTNYDIGAKYRAAIMRYCADNGLGFVDLPSAMSYVVSMFSGFQTPNLAVNGNVDMMQDNIHPSSFAARLQGFVYARAAAGLLVPKASLATGWITVAAGAYSNSWTQFAGQPLKYRIDSDGFVHFNGVVNIGTTTDNTLVVQLPGDLSPRDPNIRFTLPFDNGVQARFEIDPNAAMRIFSKTAGTATYFFADSIPPYRVLNGRP